MRPGLPAHGFTDSTPFHEDTITDAKATGIVDGSPDNTFSRTTTSTAAP